MKCIRRAGWALLLVAGGAVVGCHKCHHQGPYYGGWGGCYSQMETDRATGRIKPCLNQSGLCSHGECRQEVVHGGTDGVPMVPADEGGHPVWSQPANGAGTR